MFRTSATACSGEKPHGGSWRAMTRARSRACGSVRSCIQPCSSHSRMAPASNSTEIAHPRSVRIAGRRSFVINIEINSCRRRIRPNRLSFQLLTQSRDSNLRQQHLLHVFRSSVHDGVWPPALGPVSTFVEGRGLLVIRSIQSKDTACRRPASLAICGTGIPANRTGTLLVP